MLCLLAWMSHEAVAHWDVYYAAPLRRISIWEVHVHNYMATIPLYLLMLILVINWDTVLKLASLKVSGEFSFRRLEAPHGGSSYLRNYLLFMTAVCVLPYLEENTRCLHSAFARAQAALVNVFITSTGSFLPGPPVTNDRDGGGPRVHQRQTKPLKGACSQGQRDSTAALCNRPAAAHHAFECRHGHCRREELYAGLAPADQGRRHVELRDHAGRCRDSRLRQHGAGGTRIAGGGAAHRAWHLFKCGHGRQSGVQYPTPR